MKIISLLRHAKSDWQDPAMRDFDRPLNDKGEKVARTMGQWAASQKIKFDHIIASPALRVEQTLKHFADGYGNRIHVEWERKIYLASSVTILDVIRDASDEHDHILVVGHNPGLEDVIFDMVRDDGSSPLRDEVEKKYPTGAYAQLHMDIEKWSDISNHIAKLEIFVPPRDLDPSFGPDII